MGRHHRVLRSVPFVFALALAGCGSPAAPDNHLPVTRVIQGSISDGDASQRLVVRSQADLAAAWNAMFLTLDPMPPMPAVDFSQEMVIIARAGAKPTGGYCIAVDSAVGNSRSAMVTVRSGSPSPGQLLIQVVTHPYDVVRVPRSDEVTFTETSSVGSCAQ